MATDIKPRSNRLLMVVGVLFALVAFFGVVLFGGRGGGGSQGSRNNDVVVAAVDIPAGTLISAAVVTTAKYAPEQIPASAKTLTKDAVGQFAAVALPKNTVLTGANLVGTSGAVPAAKKPYLDIPSGQVAIAIPAGGELQAVGGFIQPDDRVDIIWQPQLVGPGAPPAGTANPIKTTFQNLRIVHVGPVGSPNTTGLTTSFIVFVSLADAEALTMLFTTAQQYKLALTSQKDAQKNDTIATQGVSGQQLLTRFNIPKG